jgi:hypothetical protein
MPRRGKIAPQTTGMTAAEFKRKWRAIGKETSAYKTIRCGICTEAFIPCQTRASGVTLIFAKNFTGLVI